MSINERRLFGERQSLCQLSLYWRSINAVRIFNNKEVDEIIFLDISASIEERDPDFKLIEAIADECYMPFAVGGGIKTIGHIRQLLYVGAEKVCLNTAAIENPLSR